MIAALITYGNNMMKKNIIILALLLILCGCIRVHKMDVEQGNIITPEMISQLHIGMSEEHTEEIMGTPMVVNTFNDNRKEYVYTYKPGYGELQEKMVILTFRNGVLKTIR